MSNSKINKLQNLMITEDVDASAIVPGSNFLYLTGGNFHLMERPTILIISKDKKPIAILLQELKLTPEEMEKIKICDYKISNKTTKNSQTFPSYRLKGRSTK